MMPKKRMGRHRILVLAICQLIVAGAVNMYVEMYVPNKYFAFRLAVRVLWQLSIIIFGNVLAARFLKKLRKPPVISEPETGPDHNGDTWPPAPKVPPSE